ncbi:MAG: glycosyltransferase [Verrucomicrobiales bacterium]|nr:glycosyltransferase [Verrucomicrobiales bacterium]
MADEFYRYTGRQATICPFISTLMAPLQRNREVRLYDFLYVASGEPHKNHENLIEAWKILASDSIRPSLALTIDEGKDAALWNRLADVIREWDLNIVNHSDQSNVEKLYQSSGALIYPSTFESLGLPLLEAREFNLPVIAAELDFVRDSIDPEQTFDPASPRSIARAVKRFLGYGDPRPAIVSSQEFLKTVRDLHSR